MTIKKDLITLAPNCGLLPEEIAILPSAGIFAVQIMQTLCQYQPLPKGSKVSIANLSNSNFFDEVLIFEFIFLP